MRGRTTKVHINGHARQLEDIIIKQDARKEIRDGGEGVERGLREAQKVTELTI